MEKFVSTKEPGRIIYFSMSATNCHIQNSWQYVENDELKEEFVLYIMEQYPAFAKGPRTVRSYIREWKAHNILYRWGYKLESTRDTDLNINEKISRRIGYYLISLFFKERAKIV